MGENSIVFKHSVKFSEWPSYENYQVAEWLSKGTECIGSSVVPLKRKKYKIMQMVDVLHIGIGFDYNNLNKQTSQKIL